MPLFNESFDAQQKRKHHHLANYVYSLSDAFQRRIPVTSIEFNPPPVSQFFKQEVDYWRDLEHPDPEDRKIIKVLKEKAKNMAHCLKIGSFMSVTDSAAGILRMHNLTMLRLMNDPDFSERWLGTTPVVWDPRRTILHLTRNHEIAWLKRFLQQARKLGFNNLLLITGDPLQEMKLPFVRAEEALRLPSEQENDFRLKNSIELLHFIKNLGPDFYAGVGHNPFLKGAAETHLLRKMEVGADFIITQPVSYYEECWQAMDGFQQFCKGNGIDIPVILGVFNYSVPCGSKGYREEVFEKRYKFWKRLFGFVPQGVRSDYDLGLNGIEILARSINKLKRMGSFHFDVMNAEKKGWTIIKDSQRLTHELDRITGSFDNLNS